MSEEKKANIRNSTAEFLIFTGQSGENSIEVRVAEESVWLTQKLMETLFDVSVPTINEHLTNLFNQNEIYKTATIRKFRIVQKEGNREVARNIEFYNLEAIIAGGTPANLSVCQGVLVKKMMRFRGFIFKQVNRGGGNLQKDLQTFIFFLSARTGIYNAPCCPKKFKLSS